MCGQFTCTLAFSMVAISHAGGFSGYGSSFSSIGSGFSGFGGKEQ